MSNPLRLVIAFLVLFLPAYFGWQFRNPLIIPIFGAIYVPLYFVGKMGAWQSFGYAPTRNAILKAIPSSFVVQTILAGFFYLVGLGLGTLFADKTMASSLDASDAAWITVFAAITIPLTIYIAYAERKTSGENIGDCKIQPAKIQKETCENSDTESELIMGVNGGVKTYQMAV